MVHVKDELRALAAEVDDFLALCLKGRDIPDSLLEAMEYSLLAGGKRLRPALCLVWAQMGGLPRSAVMPFAAALELIHTYSLIHDDLPALDNDDLRRGRPSSHKMWGEAQAILAGDGLLTESFGLMCRAVAPATQVLHAVSLVANAAGAAGMVGGQVLDMQYTGKPSVGLDKLQAMHALKTGALIRAACTSGAVLASMDTDGVERARTYGSAIGVAFQIVDDILDIVGDEATLGKPVGSDQQAGKNTYPSLVGLDESRRMAWEHVALAEESLGPYHTGSGAAQADFLLRLARYIVERVQ